MISISSTERQFYVSDGYKIYCSFILLQRSQVQITMKFSFVNVIKVIIKFPSSSLTRCDNCENPAEIIAVHMIGDVPCNKELSVSMTL